MTPMVEPRIEIMGCLSRCGAADRHRHGLYMPGGT
jgi:hypothetical protein